MFSSKRHRIGQKEAVSIFRLVTKNTIEERIIKIYQTKKLQIAELVYKASYLQVGYNREDEEQVEVQGAQSLYDAECKSIVPYVGEGTETVVDIDELLDTHEEVSNNNNINNYYYYYFL